MAIQPMSFIIRAIYHLAPRSIWWAAPVPATRYPDWWLFTTLTPPDILQLASDRQVDVILADGFQSPPVSGPYISFDADTHLISLTGSNFVPKVIRSFS